MTTVKLNHLDYMSQPSFALTYDFFLLSESIFLTSTFSSFLQSLRNASNFSAQNWWYWRVWWDFSFFRLFPIFVSWFYQHAKGLNAATDNIRCKRFFPPSDTGAQNSVSWPRGGFLGLAPQTKLQLQIEMWNTRIQCSFYQFVFWFCPEICRQSSTCLCYLE